MISLKRFNAILHQNVKFIMVLWVKDTGGYPFDPNLTCPKEPHKICGDVAYGNKLCGKHKYLLRVFVPWKKPVDIHDNDLTVLYIKALLFYCNNRRR